MSVLTKVFSSVLITAPPSLQTNLNNVAVLSLAVDTSTTPSTFYAGTYGGGVVASTDGFNQNLTFAQAAPDSNLNYVTIDDNTTNPATVYVGTGDSRAIGADVAQQNARAYLYAARSG